MTRGVFFRGLNWTGEGVAGLGLGLGLPSGSEGSRRLGLGWGVESGSGRGDGAAEEEAEAGLEEKKEVIWNCLFTSGDRPLLWRRDGAM